MIKRIFMGLVLITVGISWYGLACSSGADESNSFYREIWSLDSCPSGAEPVIYDRSTVILQGALEVVALNIEDGTVRWMLGKPEGANYTDSIAFGEPIVNDDLLITGSTFGIRCINMRTGKDVWFNGSLFEPVQTILHQNELFTISGKKVVSLNPENGRIKRKLDVKSYPMRILFVKNNRMIVQTVENEVLCLDKSDGGMIWEVEIPEAQNIEAYGNNIVVLDRDFNIDIIRASDGTVVQRKEKVEGKRMYIHDLLYLYGKGKLVCYESVISEPVFIIEGDIWNYDSGSKSYITNIAEQNNRKFVATYGGKIFEIDGRKGKVTKSFVFKKSRLFKLAVFKDFLICLGQDEVSCFDISSGNR